MIGVDIEKVVFLGLFSHYYGDAKKRRFCNST